MGRGTCPPSSRPAPPALPLPSSAPGSRACRGTLPPPGPAPHSPPRARNLFSQECQGVLRGFYFPGAQGAPESSRFCSWERKKRTRDLGPLPASHLCLIHTLTPRGPQPTAFIIHVRREKAQYSSRQGESRLVTRAFWDVVVCPLLGLRESLPLVSMQSLICPLRKQHSTPSGGFSILPSQEVLPDV